MTPTRITTLFAFALALTACGDDSTDTPYVPDPPTADETPSRADCEEADFQGDILRGPGFVDGAYAGPTDGPLVATSTVLYLRDAPGAGERFQALMGDISASLAETDGLLGVALGGSPTCGAYRTLALWRDTEAMIAFVGSDAHLAAVRATPEVADRGTRTVHWTFDPAGEALSWPVGIERTNAAAALAGLGEGG